MTLQQDMTAPKMTRVAVRVPRTTLDQINAWVDMLGVRRSHFLGIALVAGVRSLMRASALETSLVTESTSRQDAETSSEAPDRETSISGPADAEDLAGGVEALKDGLASLQAEIAALKEQLSNLRNPEQRP